jgi:extradiol dioxygenase family protein
MLLLAMPVQGLAAASMLYCAGHGSEVSDIAEHARAIEPAGHQRSGQIHSDVALAVENLVGDTDQLSEPGHTCGVCASCCSTIALANRTAVVLLASPLMAQFQPLTASISALPVSAPERPPRA